MNRNTIIYCTLGCILLIIFSIILNRYFITKNSTKENFFPYYPFKYQLSKPPQFKLNRDRSRNYQLLDDGSLFYWTPHNPIMPYHIKCRNNSIQRKICDIILQNGNTSVTSP
jgi:hypothetical protein